MACVHRKGSDSHVYVARQWVPGRQLIVRPRVRTAQTLDNDTVDSAVDPAGAAPATRGRGPIFVVGSMRSGSTMLRLILDSHPDIAIGAETGFMGALLAAKTIPNWRYGDRWYERLGCTEAEMDVRLHEFYGEMFARYAAAQGKRRWGEKTPFHTAHIPAMAQVFPDAVFVGIVRHPGAVAASLRDNFHYEFIDAVSYWTATNLDLIRAGAALGPRFVLCRYEDLVTDSEKSLRELVDWLEEPWSADVLEHHRVQRDKGAPRVVDGSTSSRERIDARRAASWVDSVAAPDRAALDEVAPLAAFLGYGSGGVSQSSAQLWDGSELARRRAAWADRVDFESRPPSLTIDASPEQLARRLAELEQALARTRARRSVQFGEAVRKVQRGRSWGDVREAWMVVRGLLR